VVAVGHPWQTKSGSFDDDRPRGIRDQRLALRRLAHRHGSEVETLLGDARDTADLGAHFGGGLYEREVEHFVREEWALTVDDVIWRRSKAGLHMPSGATAALAGYLARLTGTLDRLAPAGAEAR